MKFMLVCTERNTFCDSAEQELYSFFGERNCMIYKMRKNDDFHAACFHYKPEYIFSFMAPVKIPKQLAATAKKETLVFCPTSECMDVKDAVKAALKNKDRFYRVVCRKWEDDSNFRVISAAEFDILEEDDAESVELKAKVSTLSLFREILMKINEGEALIS